MASQQEPLLVYLHGKKNKRSQTFYSLAERHYVVKNTNEIRGGHVIVDSSHGWLLVMAPDGDAWLLLNPVTMEKIQLPDWPERDIKPTNWALSSPPHDPSCVVMFTLEHEEGRVPLVYCKPGDEVWTRQKLPRCICCDRYPHEDPRLFWNPTFATLNGEIYALTSCCAGLVKFQFDRNINGYLVMRLLDLSVRQPDPTPTSHYFFRHSADDDRFLVQCSDSDELMIVEVYYGDNFLRKGCLIKDMGCKGIVLYKINLKEQVCQEVEALPKDCAIFLGYRQSGFMYKIPRKVMDSGLIRPNTIYFTELGDRCIYSYDVAEASISVSLPCPNIQSDYYEPRWTQLPLGTNWFSFSTADDSDDPQLPKINVAASKLQITLSSGSGYDDGGWYDIPIKTWQSSLSNYCASEHHRLEKVLEIHRLPILMHIGNSSRSEQVHFFDPITNSTNTLPLPPGSIGSGAVVRCSKYGWLLMSQGSKGERIFFFNPFTNERIELPDLWSYELDGITFTSAPTSPDCMVLGYSVWSPTVMLVSIRRGERKWTYSAVKKKGTHLKNSYSNPVYHQGLFYIMGRTGNLCIHDPKQRGGDATKVTNLPRKPCTLIRRSYLLECRGKLLSVFTGRMGRFLRVYELNQATMAWKELHSLEDVMLFLNDVSLLSATSNQVGFSGLGNKVFLDRFSTGEAGVFYSLATRKFHTFWSGYKSNDWRDTKEYTNSAWIEPNFDKHTEKELQWFDPAAAVMDEGRRVEYKLEAETAEKNLELRAPVAFQRFYEHGLYDEKLKELKFAPEQERSKNVAIAEELKQERSKNVAKVPELEKKHQLAMKNLQDSTSLILSRLQGAEAEKKDLESKLEQAKKAIERLTVEKKAVEEDLRNKSDKIEQLRKIFNDL